MANNPYNNIPDYSFWRKAVSNLHITKLADLFIPLQDIQDQKIATAGSCFAQHIGKNLQKRKLNYLDLEKAPATLAYKYAVKFGYFMYSCRYGNIYTPRQLLQLLLESLEPKDFTIWERDGRFYDAVRPSIEPFGFSSKDELIHLRVCHLNSVRELFEKLDIFVFTLGLTEAWASKKDGKIFPIAPGVIAGEFSETEYQFINFDFVDTYRDLEKFVNILRSFNKNCKIILTVSPVPLIATASGQHVLTATTYSKSVLRAVAGDIVKNHSNIYYFPSYEIISTHPSKGMFFNPDQRTICESGVDLVMGHFFGDHNKSHLLDLPITQNVIQDSAAYIHCDEESIDNAKN